MAHSTFCQLSVVFVMAMFMHVRERKIYGKRRDFSKCKELVDFETESINFSNFRITWYKHGFLFINNNTNKHGR